MPGSVRTANQFVVYVDLRKYGQTERRLPPEDTYLHLNALPRMLCRGLEPLTPRIISLLTDTATFSISPSSTASLPTTLQTTKRQIDQYFAQYDFDSNLSFVCTYGLGYEGTIKAGASAFLNLCGPVMNQLQRLVTTCEADSAILSSAVIAFDDHAMSQVATTGNGFRRVECEQMDVWVLEESD
jgi:hypothetical protein